MAEDFSPENLTDSEYRSLRPIGRSVPEVVALTGTLLSRLTLTVGVEIRRAVHVGPDRPPVGWAITMGTRVLLIESVAWPSGTYQTARDGRVLCDGIYIGQSVQPLIRSVRRLRRSLPAGHRVSAAVVVHPYGGTPAALPQSAPHTLAWLQACDATWHIGRLLRR